MLIIVGGRELRHDRVVEAGALARRAQPAALGIPTEQQLVAAEEIDARLQARTDDVEIALVAVERRARVDGRAQGRGIVEVVDVVDAVGLEEPAEPLGGRAAGQADVERAVVPVVGRKDIGARAAKSDVEHPVGADVEIDPVVLVDLIAERRRPRTPRPGGVELAVAAGNPEIVALAAIGADVPVEALVDPAVLRLALFEAPRSAAAFHERPWRGTAGLHDDVDHAAHVLAAVDDRGRATHDLDPVDVGERHLGEIGGAGSVTVDQHQHLALEITPLAIGGCAADVDRGLTGRPFAHEAHGVLREQFGHRLRRRALDLGVLDDLHRTDHVGARAPGRGRSDSRRIRGNEVASDDLDRTGHAFAGLGSSTRRDDDLTQRDLRGCRLEPSCA